MSYQQQSPDAELPQRLAQADTVISGVVVDTAPMGGQPASLGPVQNPDWQRATVQIETVEKGKVETKTMDVLFAKSTDIAWHRSPKLAKGDHVVLLLHRRDPFGRAVPGLAVVHPSDKQAITELPKVRGLLKR
jgi:hypothetical protein